MNRQIMLSDHTYHRLQMKRQKGIRQEDVVRAAQDVPGFIRAATRFRFESNQGVPFFLVLRDVREERRVITVIGKGA